MTALQSDRQPSFDIGTPLSEVTFCVVDLETTGSTAEDAITEIGAVKVRGGQVLGEFQTLVNPGRPIPATVTLLTSITATMVAAAPRIAAVLPTFLEFAAGSVLVAHNARFDLGFLRRAAEATGVDAAGTPLTGPVLDTVALARSVLLRDEVANCRLGTLARHFRSGTEPNHRALSDARATVDVLHGLIERVGSLQVDTLEELLAATRLVSPERRAKRTLAEGLPTGPGVYLFQTGASDDTRPLRAGREVLYVGTSVDVRTRVRSYFTASEKRPRMEEMVRVADHVEAISCSTALEASVLELRLIAAHRPRYNRRSKFPQKQQWVKLTAEIFPRLSLVRAPLDDGAHYLGPFRSRALAEQAMHCLVDAHPVRQCTERLSPRRPRPACSLAELGRCPAPCDGSISAEDYAALMHRLGGAMGSDVRSVEAAATERVERLVCQQRYEEAAVVRDRLAVFGAAVRRQQRIEALIGCPQVVAALPHRGGWEIHVIRHARLAGAATSGPGQVPQVVAREITAAAASVAPPTPATPPTTTEEMECIAGWLERPGIRLIDLQGDWSWPLHAVGVGLTVGSPT